MRHFAIKIVNQKYGNWTKGIYKNLFFSLKNWLFYSESIRDSIVVSVLVSQIPYL